MALIVLVATATVHASDASKAAGAGHLTQEQREILQRKMKEQDDRMRATLRMLSGEISRDPTGDNFIQSVSQAMERVTSGHPSVTQNKKGE